MTTEPEFQRAFQLHQRSRFVEAQQLYRSVVARNPAHHEAWAYLGLLGLQTGNLQNAVQGFTRAAELAPDVFDYHLNLGTAYQKLGRWHEAATSFGAAITIAPNRGEGHFNLAVALDQVSPEQSLMVYERAAQCLPEHPTVQRAHARALTRSGELERAIMAWQRVIALEPQSTSDLIALGIVERDAGRTVASLQTLRRAVQADERSSLALAELAATLVECNALDEAEDHLLRALALDPSDLSALFGLAMLRLLLGRAEDCVSRLRAILAVNPNNCQARTNLVVALNYCPNVSSQAILDEVREWGARHGASQGMMVTHSNLRDPERQLRIGYFSANFAQLAPFLPSLFENHDRRGFEIYCYSGSHIADVSVERMARSVCAWRDVGSLTERALVEAISADGIDVLVDLTMHMNGCRLESFARRPAPVQIAWLAYPGTTGVAAIDYRLSDPYLDPLESDTSAYTEQTIRLPYSFWLYCERITDLDPGPLPSATQPYVTFGCLNSFAKFHDAIARLWATLLRKLESSRLLMLVPSGRSRERVLSLFKQQGIDSHRIECVERMSLRQYFEAYQRMDVALDVYPWNGHTTTLDAAFMGVPTVTMLGETVVGRGGLSIARQLGLDELVAKDADGYLSAAVALASDRARLAQLREALRSRLRDSPLMDGPRFARNLEELYRAAFARWCRS